jgi:RNA polymerase sigma-70 factor, ECF subfamily
MADRDDFVGPFDELFAAYYQAVFNFVVRRAPEECVEDVLAEIFLVAWRRCDRVPEDPLPWLLGIARRVLANQRRGDRRRNELVSRLRSSWSEVTGWEPLAGLSPELADALRTLSEREREALLLVAWEGLDSRQAAAVLGCSAAAFRVRLHRARHRVAAQLGRERPFSAFGGLEEAL